MRTFERFKRKKEEQTGLGTQAEHRKKKTDAPFYAGTGMLTIASVFLVVGLCALMIPTQTQATQMAIAAPPTIEAGSGVDAVTPTADDAVTGIETSMARISQAGIGTVNSDAAESAEMIRTVGEADDAGGSTVTPSDNSTPQAMTAMVGQAVTIVEVTAPTQGLETVSTGDDVRAQAVETAAQTGLNTSFA